MQKQINLVELIAVLGFPDTCLDWLRLDYHSAIVGLREFKKAVEKQRRVLSKTYHPDKQNGDLERMKAINETADFLLTLKIQPPQRVVVVYRAFMGGTSSVSTNSTTTSTGYWQGR